jgi:hypothetical protein
MFSRSSPSLYNVSLEDERTSFEQFVRYPFFLNPNLRYGQMNSEKQTSAKDICQDNQARPETLVVAAVVVILKEEEEVE